MGEKKKDRALLVLKKKKLTEHQLEQLGGLLINVEAMVGRPVLLFACWVAAHAYTQLCLAQLSNVEISKQQNKLFSVLQQGNDALKQLQAEVGFLLWLMPPSSYVPSSTACVCV